MKIDGEWKFLSLAKKDGKLDWAHLVHNGKFIPIASTSGTFYLDWLEGGKRIRRSCGDTVREAKAALALQLQVVTLRDQGVEAADAPQIGDRKKERNLEVAFAAWPDFNPKKKTLAVRSKSDLRFMPKDYEERMVPIPDKLVDLLLSHKEKQPKGSYLIFGTSEWGEQAKGGNHTSFKPQGYNSRQPGLI